MIQQKNIQEKNVTKIKGLSKFLSELLCFTRVLRGSGKKGKQH
ncbi:MAG: hypothetical protein PHC50_06575 [Candidatus Cloacimonetes bacterium]|nr:hypothetical protein [Candidatus Cloacimonadota bacterium]